MKWLHQTDKHLLFTRNDKLDPRLGEFVSLYRHKTIEPNLIDEYEFDYSIIGFPDDDGIALNGGRPGAQAAPREIRTFLYKMTPALFASFTPKILDLGDMIDKDSTIEQRHQKARETLEILATKNKRWISLGGGHDYGYCDGAAFVSANQENAIILNFDAHLDVRSTEKGYNSGTPFFRLLEEFEQKFELAEFGIQNQCNSKQHFDWAIGKGVTIHTLDEINKYGLENCVKNFLSNKNHKKIFLSIDIDCFNFGDAPGCSQSWPTGLSIKEFKPILEWIVDNFDVQAMGIYEVSPPLDHDNHTSKLAALLAHTFLFKSK